MQQSMEEEMKCYFERITADIEANRRLSWKNISDNGDIFSFRQQKVFATCSTCVGLSVVRFFILLGSLIPLQSDDFGSNATQFASRVGI